MRLKVEIEFVQITDPSDFPTQDPKDIEQYILNEVSGGILDESFRYAKEQGSLKINVKYIDDEWDND